MKHIHPIATFLTLLLLTASACKKEKEASNNTTPLPVLHTCNEVSSQELVYDSTLQAYRFTGNNGVEVVYKPSVALTMRYNNELSMAVQFYGIDVDLPYFNHENLNGKHIKDRLVKTRSSIYPDGTKVTLVVNDEDIIHTNNYLIHKVIALIIRSGNKNFYLNAKCEKLTYVTTDAAITQAIDDYYADGETASFEITETGLTFFNWYNEDSPGNKIYNRVDLGTLIFDNPNQVNDLFDDPRLAHT
jgi:hypothetical protein